MIGTRLPTTFHMITGVLAGPRMWGDAVTTSLRKDGMVVMTSLPYACEAPSCSPGTFAREESWMDRRTSTIRTACNRGDASLPFPRIDPCAPDRPTPMD